MKFGVRLPALGNQLCNPWWAKGATVSQATRPCMMLQCFILEKFLKHQHNHCQTRQTFEGEMVSLRQVHGKLIDQILLECGLSTLQALVTCALDWVFLLTPRLHLVTFATFAVGEIAISLAKSPKSEGLLSWQPWSHFPVSSPLFSTFGPSPLIPCTGRHAFASLQETEPH